MKKYGIWGFGIVGKSVLRHLQKFDYELSVMDRQMPAADELTSLQDAGILFFTQEAQTNFFTRNDVIIASPGIDISCAQPFLDKFVEEVDLFARDWKKPLIAVTGTLGKTSVVHMLSNILAANRLTVATGGNIGTGMLDLLSQQNESDYALLELSSFQLERARIVAPDLAIWTNLHQNHLDRHGSMEIYFNAKYQMIAHQREGQHALVPFSLINTFRQITDRPLHFFSLDTFYDPALLRPQDTLYVLEGLTVMRYQLGMREAIFTFSSWDQLSKVGYRENALLLLAACHLLGLTQKEAFRFAESTLPPHRLEKVATVEGTTFYNDSKSSVMEATYAAVERLQPARIHLLLGGISKGVDRTNMVSLLSKRVCAITCFGAEAAQLSEACKKAGIKASAHPTMESAFSAALSQKPEVLLLSPAGASFDLFKNYMERGDRFKALVKELGSKS